MISYTKQIEMFDEFSCSAIDQKRRDGRRFLSPKIHNHLFCFLYVELQIIFAAPTDNFIQLIAMFRFSRVGNKPDRDDVGGHKAIVGDRIIKRYVASSAHLCVCVLS